MTNRFGSFFSRVETERKVLSVVNGAFVSQKLSGLTIAAISLWATQVKAHHSIEASRFDQILNLLTRITVRSSTDADQSRVVFANESIQTLPVQELLEELQILLRDCKTTKT